MSKPYRRTYDKDMNSKADKIKIRKPSRPSGNNQNSAFRWCTLPIVVLCVIISLLVAIRLGYFVYETIIDLDNVYYCPSSGLILEDIKWKQCPQNGRCDDRGNLICNPGYIKSARECILDEIYTETSIQFAKDFHKNYLYYLGDYECGMINKVEKSEIFLESQVRYDYQRQIALFAKSRQNVELKDFVNDIKINFYKCWAEDKAPRYGPIWAIRKGIRDNLILIIAGFMVFWVVAYQGVRFVYRQIYRYKAKDIYKKLEKELRGLADTDDVKHGLSEGDIIENYRGSMSVFVFQKSIMPYLNYFRAQSKNVKTFDQEVGGRNVTKWQYSN